MKHRKITDQESAEIINAYVAGESFADIGKRHNRTNTIIRRHVILKGVPVRDREYKRLLTPEQERAVVAYYKGGASQEECTVKFSISQGLVQLVLKRHGVASRPTGGAGHKNARTVSDGKINCTGCGKMLPVEEFHVVKANSHGLSARCKECQRWIDRRRNYGITQDDYKSLLEKQGGRCKICGLPPEECTTPAHPDLVVDHSHKTGKVRGLICYLCNNALGALKDNPDRARSAAAYLDTEEADESA